MSDIKLGSKVRVVFGTDETFEDKYLLAEGVVRKFHNTECGARPRDPMIIIEFSDGSADAFWSEELELLPDYHIVKKVNFENIAAIPISGFMEM